MLNISPLKSNINSNNFVTYRRLWLDTLLQASAPEFGGVILDVGGKKENKRGAFNPPEELASSWWYINLDPGTKPNILGDITSIPIKSDSVDIIICTEVLEHLDNPAGCSAEIFRLLRPGGRAYVSAPFIYPIHADPHDYQRFTADGLRNLFKEFSSTEVFRMGGFWGTIGMLLEIGLQGFTGKGFLQKVSRRFLRWLSHQLYAVDLSTGSEQNAVWKQFTTGYFLRIIK